MKYKKIGKTVTINIIAFTQNGGNLLYSPMVNDFNKYSIDNNLNIKLKLNLFSELNSTIITTDYESTLDSLFQRKSNKYDLIFFDNIYIKRFGPYLLNLKNVLPKDHIDMYMEGVAKQTCMYNDKLVGLPMTIDCTLLYYNQEYLDKYNKELPKTWDDLIETGQYILNEEKKLNNTDFVPYNGLFSELEIGICSIYEFIYSFRNSVESSFPNIRSQEAVNALEKMKEIKEKLNLDTIYKQDEGFTISKIFDKNYLFLKFWIIPYFVQVSRITYLPGVKEGISGSTIGGHNLGISIYSDPKHRNATIEALKFLTSKNMQRKYIALNDYFSPIPSLYEEDEVCSVVNCTFYKGFQLIARPILQSNDYITYSTRFKNYIYDFLYRNKTSYEVLKNIDDITRYYYLSLNNEDTVMGLILFISAIIIIIFMLGSLLFIFINKFKIYFSFLSNDFWIIYIIGLVLIPLAF
ncbi:periplasmic binding protein-like II [Neocallimastix californiae]|uniref:Periplasmic binding protein-like II n=1 Tax=Neocallimastix californiae TaxID=1754190 RepID=A0A1Y2ECW4_9FUNG|nr:periplasmic binding protein-like II [Neocallimastix californiae]|eukprot:ORY69400.1 periplasmic binding protein-like II [Neocallimastix californiae]